MKKTLKNSVCHGMTLVCLAAISWSPMIGFAGQCGNDDQGCDEGDECCEEGNGGENKFTVYTGNVHREVRDLEIWGGVGGTSIGLEAFGEFPI